MLGDVLSRRRFVRRRFVRRRFVCASQKRTSAGYHTPQNKFLWVSDSVADPHGKNADADPRKNLNADADSCPY